MTSFCEKLLSRKNLVLSVSCTSQECNNVDNNSLSNFCLMICQVVAYGRLRAKKNFQLTALKVDIVACERWSLTRSSKYSDYTWEFLVFWKTGHWGEMVAYKYERWSQPEVRLYFSSSVAVFLSALRARQETVKLVQLTSVFYASVLLLMINCVITLSKWLWN